MSLVYSSDEMTDSVTTNYGGKGRAFERGFSVC